MSERLFRSLWFKLTAAFLLVALIGVLVVAVLANRATSTGFLRFLDEDRASALTRLQIDLANYYAARSGWDGVESLLRSYRQAQGLGQSGSGGGMMVLLDDAGQVAASLGGGNSPRSRDFNLEEGLPIVVNGRQVATLIAEDAGLTGGRAGDQFLSGVNQALLLAGLVAVLLALLLGGLLARSLTRPLRQLTEATTDLAGGNLDRKVAIKSQDELGQLANSFNRMAEALAANEAQRQQLFADIAHELRTPLSVVRGQLEGMLDGVFDMTPENLTVAHEETILLGRLVEEVRTLSLAESGQLALDLKPVDVADLAHQAWLAFEPLAEAEGIKLTADLAADLPLVTADPARLQQVLGNLLSNALRHAGRSNGRQPVVNLAVRPAGQQLQVRVEDNGPGLSAEAQRHVFDRFWRADPARTRDQGGSGLGLAICRGIVEAHGGRIWVESVPGQGATFTFELPPHP
jgi:two-component system, OmpR family, sensor histidine kinase BaeS